MSANHSRQVTCTRCGRPMLVGQEQTKARCSYCQHMNDIHPPAPVSKPPARRSVEIKPNPRTARPPEDTCKGCGRVRRLCDCEAVARGFQTPPQYLPTLAQAAQDEQKDPRACICCGKTVLGPMKDGAIKCQNCGMRQLESWLGTR